MVRRLGGLDSNDRLCHLLNISMKIHSAPQERSAMAPKRKRRYPIPSFASDLPVSDQAERRAAGANLLKHFLSLYSSCKLSAK